MDYIVDIITILKSQYAETFQTIISSETFAFCICSFCQEIYKNGEKHKYAILLCSQKNLQLTLHHGPIRWRVVIS